MTEHVQDMSQNKVDALEVAASGQLVDRDTDRD